MIANARLAAGLALAGRCAGILLDTEQYQGKLFDYRKQRDAGRRPWAEYAAQARRRGGEVMAAIQEGYPDLTVFLTFGDSLAWKQGEHGKKPMAECSGRPARPLPRRHDRGGPGADPHRRRP